MTTPVTPDRETLYRAIQDRYAEVALNPELTFHFHHGRPLAEILGYSMDQVDALPPEAVESFSGMGNPLGLGPIQPGETLLDLGSGGGFDCFIAAQAVGPTGQVIGVDMTEAMLEKSRATAREMRVNQVEFRQGLLEELPVSDGSVDVAISNGVINLCTNKNRIFQEIYRILKPGGRLLLGDMVVHRPVPDAAKANVDLWTA